MFDIHPHVISTDVAKYPRAPLGGHQSDWSQERPVSYEQMIAAMDKAGIAKSVLVQASTCYGHDCSYVADAAAAHPKRFTGVFSADILAPAALDRMRHWMGRGLMGMRLFTTGSTMPGQQSWLDDPRTFPAWGLAEEANIPVCLQMQPEGLPQMENVLKRFPRLRVVLDHLARPKQEDGAPYEADAPLWRMAKYPGVYLKATERNFVGSRKGKATPESFWGKVVEEFGVSRVAWGSNYPASEKPLTDLVKLAKDSLSFLSESDRDWIFSGTAELLYPKLAD